jgi:DNA invertase Pin-like site-specific DNA recombinase
MKSAYLYVRVSTDEQKRKGYSLPEQEDRLVKYCELNNIQVNGIFREDFSAKNFNRPEWKNLIAKIRKNKKRPLVNILFIKWDRFSRSIEYAYQIISVLRELNAQPMAIDQPIDFEVPESIVMLAVYLSIPEAENCRRGRTTSDGMRRARKMGRWSSRAPIGYLNRTTAEGKAVIIPKQPEADQIKWSFQQLATGVYTINQVGRMAYVNGLRCGLSNFWKLVHNPIYCGIVKVPASRNEEEQFVKGLHEPLISENLFYAVQQIITKDRNKRGDKTALKALFPLRGFLSCPWCHGRITGSVSHGKRSKYSYYHCMGRKCKGRFPAEALNNNYEEWLKKIILRPEVYELFDLVLEDENIFTRRRECIDQRKAIVSAISQQETHISKALKYFLDEKIDFEDFEKLKGENKTIILQLTKQLEVVSSQLDGCEKDNDLSLYAELNLLQAYKKQDIKGKRDIVNLFMPASINPSNREFNSLKIDIALSQIIKVAT